MIMKPFSLIRIQISAVLLLSLCFNPVLSQKLDSSAVLAIVPFRESFDKTDDENDYARIFAEKTLVAIDQSKRFNLIDRTDFETIMREVEVWEGKYKSDFKNKKLSDEALYWYGHRLKADFIMTGTITNLEAPITPLGSYKATIGFTIKVINIRTNQVYVTEDFSVNSGNITKTFSSKGEAVGAALTNILEPVKKFVDKFFPIHGKYARTDRTEKNGEMKIATFRGGSNRGFRLKQKVDIILIEDTSGSMPPEDIGDGEVVDVQPDFCTVKVTSVARGKNIETIPNKADVLYIRSKAD